MALRFDDKGKFYTEYISKDSVLVTMLTAAHRITGFVHVRKDQRLSDELNKTDLFLPVTEAKIFTQNGELILEKDFMVINRSHIIWLYSEAEPAETDPSAGGE
jgi:hypothetical protein